MSAVLAYLAACALTRDAVAARMMAVNFMLIVAGAVYRLNDSNRRRVESAC